MSDFLRQENGDINLDEFRILSCVSIIKILRLESTIKT